MSHHNGMAGHDRISGLPCKHSTGMDRSSDEGQILPYPFPHRQEQTYLLCSDPSDRKSCTNQISPSKVSSFSCNRAFLPHLQSSAAKSE